MAPKIIIIGGGIAGLSLALALHKINKIPLTNISVHELRPTPQTIGGAVNLIPPALRYLAMLDVLPHLLPKVCEVPEIEIFSHRTGRKLAELSFDDVEKFKYRAVRAKRGDILDALTRTWLDLGGKIEYASRLCEIVEVDEIVRATFEDGRTEEADFLIGCDGIHSGVRMIYVQPERKPEYSGVAGAYGMLQVQPGEDIGLPLNSTAMISSRRGAFMYSYCNKEKTELYVTAVMETKEVTGKEGWRVKSGDQTALKQEIEGRLGGTEGIGQGIQKLVDRVEEWYLFPVYKLPPHGKWSRGRVLLLGDAAHAVGASTCSSDYCG
jgi:2-polyprenyl-6-methoxyphenol hydroxylase-like FAD-dependent oxidoreductase